MFLALAEVLERAEDAVRRTLARLGLLGEDVRLPLVPVSDGTRRIVDAALRHAGLIEG